METLGAFLLRSGVLARDTLAAALDRQVVYGGWLDTALLELGVSDDSGMAEVLARWANYPVCAPGWLEQADPAALALLPARVASGAVVVPFAVSDEGLWIATTAPVDVEALAQLAAGINRPVLPHVCTELRIRLALAHSYGVRMDPRFDELNQALKLRSAPPAQAPSLPPLAARAAAAAPASAEGGSTHPQVFAADVIQPSAEPAPAPPPPAAQPAAPDAPRMDFAEALAHLAAATDRDGIVDATLRYALQTFRFVAFIGVLKGQVAVWAARARPGAHPGDPDAVKGTTVSLATGPTPIRTVVETRAPLLGRPAQMPGGPELAAAMGRETPRAVLLQPLLVGGRVVAILYADDGASPIKTRQASDVLAFASRVGPAFENLIRERRNRALAPSVPPPAAEEPPPPAPTLSVDLVAEAVAAAPAPDGPAPAEPAAAPAPPPPESPALPRPEAVAAFVADVEDEEHARTEAVPASSAAPALEPEALASDAQPPPAQAELPVVAGTEAVDAATVVPTAADVGLVLEAAPDEEAGQPLREEPASAGGAADVPMEVEVVTEEGAASAGPSLANMSPEAAALAAVALARARAGEDDDEDDEDDADRKEQVLGEDTSWTEAMSEVLHGSGAEGQGSDGKFKTAPDGWQQSILDAAARAGTLDKPVVNYQPHADDDEDDEPERADEEAVVFGDVTEAANASAFAAALTDTIETGRQGGEVLEQDYKAFRGPMVPRDDDDDDEDDEPEKGGWEQVVYDAVAQADAEVTSRRTSVPPPLPAEAAEPPVVTGAPIEEPVPLIDPPRMWVEALVSGIPDRVAPAREKVVALGEQCVPALVGAFPGRVTFDPFGPEMQVPDPATLSPLLDVLVRMGPHGLNVAVAHLDSRYPAHRFLATLVLARTYHPGSIPFLLRRLHDDEPRIRKLAGDALAAYVAEPGFEAVLRHLRTRVNSVTAEGRRRAIHFLGRFRDVGSVPALIASLKTKEQEVVTEAAQALHAITLQPWGSNDRKWVAWWEKNKARSRIEWLIDALRDADVEVRARAGSELAQLTRDTFGFKADGARRDRELAIKRWERWWADERRRLV